MNRRDLLKGAAVAPLAMLPIGSAIAADRGDWHKVVARYRTAVANEQRISAHCDALYKAANRVCPRRDEFFSRYNLGRGEDRKRNVHAAYMTLLIERSKGKAFTEEQVKQTIADAEAVVVDFDQWAVAHDQAFSAHDALVPQQDAAFDEVTAARTALIKTDAPDTAALLFKIELLATYLEDVESEDAEPGCNLRRDAQRLLSHGRA